MTLATAFIKDEKAFSRIKIPEEIYALVSYRPKGNSKKKHCNPKSEEIIFHYWHFHCSQHSCKVHKTEVEP